MADNATDLIRNQWDGQADSWYHQRRMLLEASRPIHEWMVDHLEARDGQRVLEIAAGPGDTGFLAASRLGAGRLTSTDLSPSMVDAARRRGAELGLTNVDYRVLDAQSMDVPDATFDGVLCRWGFMLMPEPSRAFRECHRILVPGGRLVFAVFTGPADNPFASVPAGVLIEAGHLPRPSASGWQPGILALADRSRVEALLTDAGFRSCHLETVDMTWRFTGPDDFWSFLVELTALGPLVASLPGDQREAVRRKITDRLAPFTHDGGIALPARCWGGVAVR